MAGISKPVVLICEKEGAERQRIYDLIRNDYQVTASSQPGEALTLIQRGAYQVLLLAVDEVDYPQDLNSIQVISIMHKIDPELQIIIMAAEDQFANNYSLEAERKIRSQGIFYYMMKPVEEGELRKVLREAIQRSRRVKQHTQEQKP